MGREVEAPPFEVVAHGDQDHPAELQLAGLIEGMKEHRIVDLNRALLNLFEQRDKAPFDLCEQRTQCRDGRAWLVHVKQGIVRRVFVAKVFGLFSLERQDRAEIREELREGLILFALKPPISETLAEISSIFQPCSAAYFSYMR